MAHPAFPNIQKPSYQYDLEPEDPGIVTQFEDGSQASAARFTRSRLSYSYHWNAMPDADKQTLFTFYRETVRGSARICTFNGTDGRIMSLKARPVSNSRWAVEMIFKEA